MRLLLLVSLAARLASEIGVFFDPLVEFHAAEENNTVEMRAVMPSPGNSSRMAK
jgi:hypothetical protein